MDHTYEVSSVIIVIKVLYWYDFLFINEYKFIRRDHGKGRGGGILIYIKAELLHKVVSNLLPDYAEQVKANQNSESHLETLTSFQQMTSESLK